MDLLLINPRTELEAPSKKFFREPPNGILQLKTICELKGFSVFFVDLSMSSLSSLKKILTEEPLLVGITCLTNTFPLTLELTDLIRKKSPSSKIILGGPHVTFMGRKTLQSNLSVDYIANGEADASLPQLLQELKTKPPIIKTPGITWKKKDQILKNPMPSPVDLENLPLINRESLKHPEYRVASILVNRGCPFQCSFCVRQRLFPEIRIRSPQSVIQEFHSINKAGYDHANLYDNVNLNKDFLEILCNKYIKGRLEIPWGAEIRIDRLPRSHTSLLKDANCQGIAIGVETANEEVLKRNQKPQDLKLVKKGVQNAQDAGLVVQAYFVVGLPGETVETFHETLSFIKELGLQAGLDRLNFFMATPYPGSDLYLRPEQYQIRIIHEKWEFYDTEHVIFETNELSVPELEEILQMAKEIEREFNG